MSPKITLLIWASIVVTVLSLISIGVLHRNMEQAGNDEPSVPQGIVRVAVFNGCGRIGLAAVFADHLRNNGFDVVNGLGANADSFEFTRTVIVLRKGDRRNAESVAAALGASLVVEQRSDDPYLIEDVAVVCGRDWNTLKIAREVDAE